MNYKNCQPQLWSSPIRRQYCPLLITAALLLCQGSAQTAQPSASDQSETVRLPDFTVSAERADAYRPNDTMSAARVRGLLIDTPASIDVLPKDLLQDLGASTMYEATRYFAGITNGRGAGAGGIEDRQVLRGFESFVRTIDNFGTVFQANFDPEFIDRVEVVKGPNSILSPTGSPGGSVNIVTKSPQFTSAQEVTVQVGNFNAQKVSFDSTGALPFGSKHWAYRVIGSYQDTSTYLPGKLVEWNFSPQLTYRISDKSQLTLKYYGIQWELRDAVANSNTDGFVVDSSVVNGGNLMASPPAGFTFDGRNGSTNWSRRFDRVNLATADFTTALAENISMRLAAMLNFEGFHFDAGYLKAPSLKANRYNPYTGQLTPDATWALNSSGQYVSTYSLLFDPTNVTIHMRKQSELYRTATIQNDYAGNFKAGPATIQSVAGFAYTRIAASPEIDRSTNVGNISLLSPQVIAGNVPKPDDSAYGLDGRLVERTKQQQLYAFTRVGFFNDRFFITGGTSRIWINDVASDVTLDPPDNYVVLSGHRDTYLGGFLIKPVKNASLYYMYSSNAALTTSATNTPLWQDGKQHEFGFKTEFFKERLSFSAAHFQITQNNVSSPNPAFNTDPTQPHNLLVNQTSRGYEFTMVGGVTPNLSVIASLTQMKLRDAFGRRQRNIPDRTQNLVLNYHFTEGPFKNLSALFGATHMGDTVGETVTGGTPLGVLKQPSFTVPAWTAYNVSATYRCGHMDFKVNVDNLLNKKFAWEPASRFSVNPYPGINIRLTTTYHF